VWWSDHVHWTPSLNLKEIRKKKEKKETPFSFSSFSSQEGKEAQLMYKRIIPKMLALTSLSTNASYPMAVMIMVAT